MLCRLGYCQVLLRLGVEFGLDCCLDLQLRFCLEYRLGC